MNRATGGSSSTKSVGTKARRLFSSFIGLPLFAHAAIAGSILVVLIPFVRIGPTWTSDEGAVRAQVEVLATENSWSRERPFADVDPEEAVTPIHASTISGDRYYPYTKRPAYPMLLVPIRSLLGRDYVVVPSLVGTVAAALAGAGIAGLLDRRLRTITFWILVLASPLFFYSFTVIAHTIAAALTTIAVLAVLRPTNRVVLMWILAGGSMFAAALLRTEAVAFGLALSVAIVGVRPVAARVHNRLIAFVIGGAVLSAHVLSQWWALRIAGAEPVAEAQGILDGVRFASGAFSSLVALDFGESTILVVVVLIIGGAALLTLTVRREPENLGLQRVLAGAAITGSLALLTLAPEPMSGLLAVSPLLVAGLIVLHKEDEVRVATTFLLTVSVVYFVAILTTQDRGGGGAQWGGRYFLLAVPILIPVAVRSLRQLFDSEPSCRALVIGTLVIASTVLTVDSALVLREGHRSSEVLNLRVVELASAVTYEGGGRPVVVSSGTQLGRHAWSTLAEIDYFLPSAERFGEYTRRLAGEDLSRIGLVGDWDGTQEALFKSLGYVRMPATETPYLALVRVDG